MSIKMKCLSKWNVTQNGISLKMEFLIKWNVTNKDVTQNGMYWGRGVVAEEGLHTSLGDFFSAQTLFLNQRKP